jgi:hypothetical protein
MGIVITIATLAILGFIGWLIYRAVRGRQIKAHHIIYGIAVITGIYTYGFFLSMSMPQPIKILVSLTLGIALIVMAAFLQRRQPAKP